MLSERAAPFFKAFLMSEEPISLVNFIINKSCHLRPSTDKNQKSTSPPIHGLGSEREQRKLPDFIWTRIGLRWLFFFKITQSQGHLVQRFATAASFIIKVWFFFKFVLFEWNSQCLNPEGPFVSTKTKELGVLRRVSASTAMGSSAWRRSRRAVLTVHISPSI